MDSAAVGTFTLTPDTAMHDTLGRDYAAMSGMIFGDIPRLDEVLASVATLQETVNNGQRLSRQSSFSATRHALSR